MKRRNEQYMQKYAQVQMYRKDKDIFAEKARQSGRSVIGLLEVIAARLEVDERGGVSMGGNGHAAESEQ